MLIVAPVPFLEALAPWLDAAERRLTDTVPGLERVLTSSALAGLIDGLAQDLACVTSPTLLDLFLQDPHRSRFTPRSRAAHEQFVRHLSTGGLDHILGELPELARLVEQVVDGWCGRVCRMAGRVESDRRLLEEHFSARLPFDCAVRVVDTTVELGDASGTRVVYKDRPLGMDAAFCVLLRWVNTSSACWDLFVPLTIDRGEFGWMAYVPQRPAHEPQARQAHLTRVGMLLCLVHALGGGDVHADNVRVFGEHPVIIDAEVLLRPRRASEDGDAASVLATGWLPTVLEVERCGLTSGSHLDRPRRWVNVGTDAVRQRPLRSLRAGTRPEVVEYFRREWPQSIEHLCEGFRAMYALVAERGLPLDAFVESRPRVLLRTSYLYQETIERSLRPVVLSSVAGRAVVIEEMVREAPPAMHDLPSVAAAVAAAERRSMDALQVPRFSTCATSRRLLWQAEVLGEPFRQSPLQRAGGFIAEMSPSAMEAHCRDIADAIGAAAQGALEAVAPRLEILPKFDAEAT